MCLLVSPARSTLDARGVLQADKIIGSRTPWQSDPDSMKDLSRDGKVNDEGYVNVADQLGLSGERGMSSFISSTSFDL